MCKVILKKKSRKNIRQFLVDTNLFIAAVKNPKKETKSLRLLSELILITIPCSSAAVETKRSINYREF